MNITKPVLGKLTQGTIFTGARAENYVGVPTWGLCITARCDMAHEGKTNAFSYLPIIAFDEWILRDGARLLADRLFSEFRASAVNLLKNAKKSPSILDSYPADFISETILPDDLSFKKIAAKITTVERIRKAVVITPQDFFDLSQLNNKCTERLIKELWALQLTGFYFIKSVGETEHECNAGYVLLLREVHHLPQSLSIKIADGLLINNDLKKNFTFFDNSAFDFAFPTALISSPWIENIMQNFSLLFSRIGLPDPNPLHLTVLNERVNRDI